MNSRGVAQRGSFFRPVLKSREQLTRRPLKLFQRYRRELKFFGVEIMYDRNFLLPLTIVVCAVIFFVLQNFVWEPARRDVVNMQLETRRLREIEREISELKTRHGNLEVFVAKKDRELDTAQEFLPSEPSQEKFIDEIYRAADLQRAQIISVRAGEISDGELQSQIVTVALETNYISLTNFIREILDGKRLTTLEKFSVTGTGGKILSCELTFQIFSMPPPQNAKSSE